MTWLLWHHCYTKALGDILAATRRLGIDVRYIARVGLVFLLFIVRTHRVSTCDFPYLLFLTIYNCFLTSIPT